MFESSEGATTEQVDPTIALIRERKLEGAIANELGIARQAVWQWKRVPPTRVLKVASILGREPHLIRPDLYPVPTSQ